MRHLSSLLGLVLTGLGIYLVLCLWFFVRVLIFLA